MTGYQDAYNPAPQYQQPRKGWFARSWWWFLPLVIGGPIVLCCGSCGGLFWFGLSSLSEMPPYVDGVAACETSPEIQALIGSPVEAAGVWDTMASQQGDIQGTPGAPGIFYANIPVTGSTGSGWLYIEADSSDGTNYTYQMLEFEDDATGTVVNLLSSPNITPDPSLYPDGAPDPLGETVDELLNP